MSKTNAQHILSNYTTEKDGDIFLYKVPINNIALVCTNLYNEKGVTLKSIFATNEGTEFKIYYAFAVQKEDYFLIPYIILKDKLEFPSLTDTIYSATFFEREIYTMFGIKPIGHKHLQPMILHANWPKNKFPMRKDFKWDERPKMASPEDGQDYKFQKVEGEGIYEIPVGPVHAGIIEPGHFRFSAAGEEIVNLEPVLGYVHKGTEKLFEVLPMDKKITLSEHISGDSSFSHSLAFCQAVESLGGLTPPTRALYLRTIFAELERLANHFGDLGFIMNDTGFSFGGAQLTRLREIIMQMNEKLSGSRFLKNINTIGGVKKDINKETSKKLSEDLLSLENDFNEIIAICQDSETVMNRLKGTGKLSYDIAWDHDISGVAARASGIPVDTRKDFPYAAYPSIAFDKALEDSCDVNARFKVRVHEVHSSISIIQKALKQMPEGSIVNKKEVNLKKNSRAISLVEGWRGEIFYCVLTDGKGNITRVAVRDPSFLNWQAVPYAVLGNIVPDFPLINKSFNLSYSGNDR